MLQFRRLVRWSRLRRSRAPLIAGPLACLFCVVLGAFSQHSVDVAQGRIETAFEGIAVADTVFDNTYAADHQRRIDETERPQGGRNEIIQTRDRALRRLAQLYEHDTARSAQVKQLELAISAVSALPDREKLAVLGSPARPSARELAALFALSDAQTALRDGQQQDLAESLRNLETANRSATILLWVTGLGLLGVTLAAARVQALTQRLERRDRTRALEKARASHEASRAKSQLLAIMSHEIRTPLNGVLGMAEIMSRHPLVPEQQARLQALQESGRSLLELLNDALDYSKIEAGKIKLDETAFCLNDTLRRVKATFAGVAESKGLALILDLDDETPAFVLGDPLRLRQVLMNLVGNALKFTPTGAVTIRSRRIDDTLLLTVTDTGAGMTPDALSRVFQAYAQAERSTAATYGGTGLGLTISRELVRLMGGDISVESTLGVGSAFTVSLPLRIAVAPTEQAPSAVHDPAPSAPSGLRVLVAEDNAVNRTVLAEILSQLGLNAVLVEDGAQVLQAFEAELWDLVLMDVQMPVLDGEAAITEIRRKETDAGVAPTPIIALTANTLPEQVERYRRGGANAVVAKPIDIRQLAAAISACVKTGDGAAEPQTS